MVQNSDEHRYRAPALEKGLDIIEALAREPAGLTQVEIARSLSRSVGEVYRVLASLERRDYLHLDADTDRYTLTLKLFELAHAYAPTKTLIAAALPRMESLARTTGQSCHLAVHKDGKVLVLAQVDGQEDMALVVRAGATFDLLATASGYVLLAFQQPGDRDRIMKLREAATGTTPVDGVAFDARIATTRAVGFEQSPSMAMRGVTNVSYPVLNNDNAAVAAITVTYVDRIDKTTLPTIEDVRGLLSVRSREIATDLGFALGHT